MEKEAVASFTLVSKINYRKVMVCIVLEDL